jgi:transcriptional regulator with XRE-family HTH domain
MMTQLKFLRQRAGATQQQLAVAARTTPATVSRLENGGARRRGPHRRTIVRLAEALHYHEEPSSLLAPADTDG